MSEITRIGFDRVQETHEELEDDHKRVMSLVEELIVPHMPRTTEDLYMLLQDLQNDLLGHFSREQSPGGFYEYLGACNTDFRRELRILMNEHIAILSTIHCLTEHALAFEKNSSYEAEPLDLFKYSTDLSVRLFEHELKEHTMVSKLAQIHQKNVRAVA